MRFEDLYSDYEYDELEVRELLRDLVNDEIVAAEAAKIYQMNKSRDLKIAERMLLANPSMKSVNNVIHNKLKTRSASRPEFTGKLRKILIANGHLPDCDHKYHAHHIVAKGDKRSRRAVEILRTLGIDIHGLDNGVFLPASESDRSSGNLKNAYVHGAVHTKAYYANVNFELIEVFSQNTHLPNSERRAEIIDVLTDIGERLQNGTYPIYLYLPGAEYYAG